MGQRDAPKRLDPRNIRHLGVQNHSLFEDETDHHSLAAEIAWLQHREACNSSVEREETKTNRRRSKGTIPVHFRSSGSRWLTTLYRQYKHLPILDPCLSTPGIRPSQYCGTLSFVPPLAVKRKTCQLPSLVYHRSVWKSSTAGGHFAYPPKSRQQRHALGRLARTTGKFAGPFKGSNRQTEGAPPRRDTAHWASRSKQPFRVAKPLRKPAPRDTPQWKATHADLSVIPYSKSIKSVFAFL